MKITITARKMQIPQSFNDYAENRLNSRLDKFFGEEADAKITMYEYKGSIVIELTVRYNNMLFRAECSAPDKNVALDAAVDKIIRQIRKNKTKIAKRLKDTAFKEGYTDIVEEQVSFEVIKHKKFVMRPMTTDEAILQMNMLGHSFFMFENAETGVVNVVYKREDDNYAVLEPVKE
ncbi:MAG TPA: ribosome-associated translation inhibitor RaiA [Ruminococcus sp.]|nr:ribosome-associated translation inhibitor RaiA [Ruminococcus sp.]HBN11361.1 ribosome-associated translation inhibitor RaiA [Ruminococcus sp.]HCR73917.1 ribosome-associated translation inhibitor RaiA [Ruminococcus sp.]